jgi:hypothetical protein
VLPPVMVAFWSVTAPVPSCSSTPLFVPVVQVCVMV